VNLIISFAFHAALVLVLFYFAAREGLLGKKTEQDRRADDQGKAAGKTQAEPEKPKNRAAEGPKRQKLLKRRNPLQAPPVAAPPVVAPPVVAPPNSRTAVV
jgi:hypothetical protein